MIITQHLKNVGQTIKYLRINKFSPDPNEQSEFCFYLCSHETFLYTANHQDTLFRKTWRENVQLLFLSKEYAWYQGDLIIPMVPMPKYARILFKYEKIIWVSEIRTSNLLQVYLPLAHLPSMMENGRQSYTSLSTLNNVNVLAQAITFEQEYHYGSEKIRLKYMIDTLDPYQALALTELYGLPAEVKSQLIEKRHLTGLAAFIKNRSQQVLTPSGINPWEMSGKNIKGLINFKTDTTILIGDRLIWPLKNSIDVKGHISARMYTNILKDSDFLISPAGIVKGMKAGDDNYFFWSVTPRQYKQNGNNWLYRLYVQEEGDDAKVMNLREFGLNNHDVVNIRNALITTEKGFIYRLSDDKKLTLFAVENAFIIGNPDWALSLTTYIGQLRNKLADASLLEPGQTKAIEIAIHVSIWGLLYGDANPPLPLSAWYDINSEQFIICKMDLGQNMINLGMSSDNQGAWILNNSKLGYVAKINTFLLGNIFTGSVLHDENKIPKISTLVLNEALGTDFVNVMLIQGNIEGLTNNGIHLNIGRTDDDIFTVTLIGVTTAFSQDHYSDTTYLNVNSLTNAIEHLCHQCICAEIIQIGLKNNLQAWYQPMKKILFMSSTLNSLENYLGFNSNKEEAYFISNKQDLIKVNRGGEVGRINNLGALYQRRNEVLILNSGRLTTLAPDEHIDADVSALLITTSLDQIEDMAFTFEIELFNYPVIYLSHVGNGSLHCSLPIDVMPENINISRNYDALFVFIENKLLVIDDVFERSQSKIKGDILHHELKLIFNYKSHILLHDHAIKQIISIQEMKDYYIHTVGNETTDGHVIIPLPNYKV